MTTPAFSISTVELPVAELGRATSWYHKALGFRVEWSDEHHALLAREDESVRLLLVQTADPQRLVVRGTPSGVVHGVLDLRTRDLDGLHAHMRQVGANPDDLGPPAHEWAPRGFGFFDSEGNRLGAFSYSQGQ